MENADLLELLLIHSRGGDEEIEIDQDRQYYSLNVTIYTVNKKNVRLKRNQLLDNVV